MDTTSLPQRLAPNTAELSARAARALVLYRSRRHDVEALGEGLYLVPSSDGENFYGVNYLEETCSCPDAKRHPELTCKHVFLIGILNAKRRARRGACAGCGDRRPLRELVEVGEGDGFTLSGERYCPRCSLAHGACL